MKRQPALLALLVALAAAMLPCVAGDSCFTMFSDKICTQRRSRAGAGYVETTECSNDPDQCVNNRDFKESYKISCRNDTANIAAWNILDCQGAPTANLTGWPAKDKDCVALGSFYIKVDCTGKEVESTTTEAFVAAVVVDLALLLILLLVIELLRRHFPQVFESRSFFDDKAPKIGANARRFFGWALTAISAPEQELWQHCGLDTLMLSAFQLMCLKLFALALLIALILCIPINATAGGGYHQLESISLSNVSNGSDRLWVTTIVTYILVAVAIQQLSQLNNKYFRYRLQQLRKPQPQNFSVLVRDIPNGHNSDEALAQTFESIYGTGTTLHAAVARNTGRLEELSKQRKQCKDKLFKARHASRQGKPKKVWDSGQEKDALVHYTAQLERLNQQFKEEKARDYVSQSAFRNAGFVTFKTVETASVAAQVEHSAEAMTWTVSNAPHVSDVVWSNINVSASSRLFRYFATFGMTIVTIVFWAVPVAFVASLTTFESLARAFGEKDLSDVDPVLEGFVSGVLSNIVLSIFSALLPAVMWRLSMYQAKPAFSDVEEATMTRLYVFFIINVFFVSLLAGSAFDALDEVLDHPKEILNLLGESLPKTGTFFTTYVLFISCVDYPLSLLHSWDIFFGGALHPGRDKSQPIIQSNFRPGLHAPREVLVFVIGIVFAAVTPVVLPFVLLFFGMAYCTTRYSALYIHPIKNVNRGLLWPALFRCIMAGLFSGLIALIGTLSVKEATAPAILLAPLLFVLAGFSAQVTDQEKRVRHLPQLETVGLEATPPGKNHFIQPELLEPDTMSADGSHDVPNRNVSVAPQFDEARQSRRSAATSPQPAADTGTDTAGPTSPKRKSRHNDKTPLLP